MTYELDETYSNKQSIVTELFIVTADDNYVAARWCYQQGLYVDFFWLAVHCLEKYMKAILLLNGRSARSYGHDIEALFADVRPLAPELIPVDLTKPALYLLDHWYEETTEAFIGRLYRDGQADNRYQLFGYVQHMEDLLKFDQVVYAIRRLCQPLEAHFLAKKRPGVRDESRRERMSKDPKASWDNLSTRLESIFAGTRGEVLQHAALNCNFPFAAANFPHTAYPYSTAGRDSVLIRRLYDPLEWGQEHFAEADDLWKWLDENVFLAKDLRKQIEAKRKQLKAKTLKSKKPT